MKQIKNSLNILSKLSNNFMPLILISVTIPMAILILLGLYFLMKEGYILYFLGFLFFMSLSFFILNSFLQNKHKKSTEGEIIIDISPESAEFDEEIRKKIHVHIDKKVEQDLEWNEFQDYALEIVSLIASFYNPKESEKELAFSIPELLLAVEELSAKYRIIIQKYIPPFANNIKLSSLKKMIYHSDKVKYLKGAYNVYRGIRVTTPAGIISELTGQVRGKVFTEVSTGIQNKIKKALLKEIVFITIELYRGAYKVKVNELEASDIFKKDEKNKADNIEPLRVVVVGQVSVGKSSLINALRNKMVAEVSVIPSTDKLSVHECKVDNLDVMKLIDLKGLDGTENNQKASLEEMTKSDLVLWVLKANQSARKLDIELKNKFDKFYKDEKNLNRKKPKILALLTHIDRLNEQQPSIVQDALKYNKEQLQLDIILPLSLNPNLEFYNLDNLKEHIQEAYDEGINTQLNRRKIEHNNGVINSSKNFLKNLF